MPRHALDSGKDFSLARMTRMRATIDGSVRLTSRNILPDPALKSFLPSGRLEEWPHLVAPLVSTGRNVYIGPAGQATTRQNASPLPRDRDYYTRDLALVNGASLPGAKSSRGLAKARIPRLYGELGTSPGYPQGAWVAAYAWVIGSLYIKRLRALTSPSPPQFFELVEGQTYELPLPEEAPEGGVPGMAILMGPSYEELYVQGIIDIREYMPPSVSMTGPLRTSWLAPRDNNTYCGQFMRYRGPTYKRVKGRVRLRRIQEARLSYRFSTNQGLSASQGLTNFAQPREAKNTFVRMFYPPLPGRARGIIPEIRGIDGTWYNIDYSFVGGEVPLQLARTWFYPYFTTNDPEKVTTTRTKLEESERVREDETGIPKPDEAPGAPVPIGKAGVPAGRYGVRITDTYPRDDDSGNGAELEGPPSDLRIVELGQGEKLRVDYAEEAEEGNTIPNADFGDRKRNGDPERWRYPYAPSTNLQVNASRCRVAFDDRTGRTGSEEVLISDPFFILGSMVQTFRAGVDLDASPSGRAEVEMRFFQADGSTLTATRRITSREVAGLAVAEVRCGPVGSGADLEWPAGTRMARLVCSLAAGTAGSRRLSGSFVHIGGFRGWVAPRKREQDLQWPLPDAERQVAAYPDGSYIAVIEDPPWAKGKGNGFEYYGSWAARKARRFFAHGLRAPVEPNTTYTLQCEYWHKGLEEHAEVYDGEPFRVLPVAVKDADDGIIADDAPGSMLVYQTPGPVPDGSGLATLRIDTGPDAAYIEVLPSTLSSGLLRAWGFQLEKGATANAWTDEHAASGQIVATLDTRTPGVHRNLARIFRAKRPLESGVTAEVPEGTDVTVSLRHRERQGDPWSAPLSEAQVANARRLGRFVELTAAASTSDLTVSPEIDELFLQTEPPRAVLLNAEGDEYEGGILIDNMPETSYEPNTEEEERSDGVPRVRELYPARPQLAGMSLRAFSKDGFSSGARQAAWDSTHGERLFVAEGWGYRRVLRIRDLAFSVERTQKIPEAPTGGAYFVHTASDITAEVIDEEALE